MQSKPRILHLLADRNLGGVGTSLSLLINSHLAEQYHFEICTPEEFLASSETATAAIFHDAMNWKTLPLLWKLKKRTRLIIQNHHYTSGFEHQNVPAPSRFRLMLKLSFSQAQQVMAVSHAQAKWMRELNLVPAKRLLAFQQCYPMDKLFALPLKVPGRPLLLAAYGRFCHMKGFDVLIQAMAKLSGEPIHLKLGGYGADEAKLRAQAAGLINVEFVGLVKDVPAFLNSCDVVVVPSRWEPFGGVCLEAKAAGRPVIVSHVDGLAEQITGCGLTVPPEDVDALAGAILSLMTTDLPTLGATGRSNAKEHVERYFTNWSKLLMELAA